MSLIRAYVLLIFVVSAGIFVPYSVGSGIAGAIQLGLYSIDYVTFGTYLLSEGETGTGEVVTFVDGLIDLFIPIYIEPKASDIGLMVFYWILGLIVIRIGGSLID